MTQEQIIAIATQAAIAAVQATMGATAPVSNPTSAPAPQISKLKPQTSKPKALPDATASAIGDIVAGATKESVENGKTLEVPKGKAILMEYSEKQLAIWGDTKEHRAIIKKYGGEKTTKFGTIWGYQPEGASEPNLAKGWFIPKSKMEEAGGQKAMIAELKKAGLKVTVGESIRAITEAFRAKKEAEKSAEASAPKAEKPASSSKPKKDKPAKKDEPKAKVVPIRVATYDGISVSPNGNEMATFSQYPDNPDLYVRKVKNHDLLYVCIGDKDDNSVFLLVGEKKGDGISDNIKHIAQNGILTAIADGTVKTVHEYIYKAFDLCDDKEGAEWLAEYKKNAA